MPNTREKLIELLNEAEEHSAEVCCFNSICEDCPGRKYGNKCRDYLKADHLIASGFIEELQNEAYDLGVESALKNKHGLSWQEAEEMREKARTDGKWIPVTERLPEKGGSYLVFSSKSKTVFTAHYWKGDRFANRANGQFITHWMPLPEPPKDGA